jgi:hypothetical protein
MAATPVQVYPANLSKVINGGQPVTAIFGGIAGGLITNPANAADQGIANVEVLFYDLVNPAGSSESVTTVPLQPGQSVVLPAGLASNVSVNASTTGHRFSAIVWQQPPVFPPVPVPGTFPPSGPTSLLNTVPSYLYEQYYDDDDLQAFVASFNSIMQEYIDWFNQVGLPVYTGTLISGPLLDWVAQGLYGMSRPSLSSGRNQVLGPYNTAQYNVVPWDGFEIIGPQNITVTTDDIFKRIMTWRLYRGDGKTFNLEWLKRRIMRFLLGDNGTDPGITNTYQVSAFYASRFQIDIVLPNLPNATVLKQAIDSGAVELPFQIAFSVTVA